MHITLEKVDLGKTVLYAIVAAVLFLAAGLAGSAVLFGGQVAAAMNYFWNGFNWLFTYQTVAGVVAAITISRMRGGLLEIVLASAISAFLAIYLFDVLLGGSLRALSIPACIFVAVPGGMMACALAALPRLVLRVVQHVG
jgi:hypothetical protein